MKDRLIIDSHVHIGPRKFEGLRLAKIELWHPFERLKKNLDEIGAQGAVLLPYPEDIYRVPYATKETAQQAHDYILNISKNNPFFFPFYFVWGDFTIPDNLSEFKGVKIHRHFWSEPETYDYSGKACDRFVEAAVRHDLPIIIEESFINTKHFCDKYPNAKIIIPHCGLANGRAWKVIPAFKDYPNVYLETSLVYPYEIIESITQYGPDRIMFGSDSPYSSTKIELFNLLEHEDMKHFNEKDMEKILAGTLLKLMHVRL